MIFVGNPKMFCMFAVRQLLVSTAKSQQFSGNYTIKRSFSHSFSSAIGGCRRSERATLFLFLVLIAIFLTMRQPLENNCDTVNNSTCTATPTASDMAASNQNGHKCPEEIIKDFILNDEVKNIRETLNELFYEWVQSETDYHQQYRCTVLFHYQALLRFLDDAEKFEKQRRAT